MIHRLDRLGSPDYARPANLHPVLSGECMISNDINAVRGGTSTDRAANEKAKAV
jgi:hypothetical protein